MPTMTDAKKVAPTKHFNEFLIIMGIGNTGNGRRLHVAFLVDDNVVWSITPELSDIVEEAPIIVENMTTYGQRYAQKFGKPLRIRFVNGKGLDNNKKIQDMHSVEVKSIVDSVHQSLCDLASSIGAIVIGNFGAPVSK